jgi:4'-phosphopantetheinyl transferase
MTSTGDRVPHWIELSSPLSPLPSGASLSAEDVHIWRSWLDQPMERVRQLEQTLSADERERASRFRFETDRTRFVVGRGTLRSILGHYLGIAPDCLQFGYGPQGKPYLHEGPDRATIQFNLAHSHQLAVFAFARMREVGIDLEHMRPVPRLQQIVASFFSAQENTTLSELPPSQQQEAFYLCWVSKEAYLKASGLGLAQPLQQFDVSLVPGEPARLLRVEGKPEETSRWSLCWLRPAPGYRAALAVEGQDWQPTYYNL